MAQSPGGARSGTGRALSRRGDPGRRAEGRLNGEQGSALGLKRQPYSFAGFYERRRRRKLRLLILPSRTSRSEEHTSELQSLMRISYAVFCLKKKTKNTSA